MKCCPTCGRAYPPKLEVHGPVRQRLVNVLVARPDGIAISDVIDLVYANAPDGAPPSARSCINVMAHLANDEIKSKGWRIVGSKGRGSRYKLVTYVPDTKRQRARNHNAPRMARAQSAIEEGKYR